MNKKPRYTKRRKLLKPSAFQLMSDIVSILGSYYVQFLIRFRSGWIDSPHSPDTELFFSSALAIMLYFVILYWFTGLYRNWYIRSPFDEFYSIIRVSFFGSLFIFFAIMMDSNAENTRLMFLVYTTVISITVSLGRFAARKVQTLLRARGVICYPSVIIGTPDSSADLYQKVLAAKNWGYRITAIVLKDKKAVKEWNEKYGNFEGFAGPYTMDQLEEVLDREQPAEALITFKKAEHSHMMNIVTMCSDKRITVKIIPDIYDIFTGKVRTLHMYGIPLIEVSTQLLTPWQEVFKRIFDIVFSLTVIVLGMPIWVVVAIAVKLDSFGPVFYKQERVGKDGENFMMYKYRSMVQNAEKGGPQWTKVNDPRVTKLGRFLRSSHLDEIPQFWNVLIGEMSLVGPRPERPVFVEKFSQLIPYYKRRLVVRPGITGWWQVKYTTYVESVEEIKSRLKDDFYYIENMSFKLDLEIIIRTVFLVFKGHGQT